MNLLRVREVFHQVSAAPREDRAALLETLCGGEAELRTEVEALLAAEERAGGFLSAPTMQLEADTDQPAMREALPFENLGAYRLVEKLGEGGYGEVFLAEQSEPVRRRVALKMLKAGLDTRQVLARFEAERQTLAMMDHPGIARIFDAGTTPQGRPFFVMEFVDGVPVTEFCLLRKVAPQQRLELFCDICRAVQHAHTRGVIHRDIKPSNVLVTEADGKPRAVVIDFGIAKAMRGLDAGETLHTGLRQLMGTPAYMSPEQAGLGGPDVDTRSDIYSLGVLLYELLTGVTPLDAAQLKAAALAELQRRISEEIPPKPSTRVAGLTASQSRTGLHADFAAPVRLLRGDLDWIVMKALEKEPERRYATAAAFADDVVRHMGHEPVSAGPPSFIYRLGKWTRRNRAAAAAAGVMMLASAIAAAGLVRGYVIARSEAAARKVQAERAESLLALQTQIFESANPESGAGSDYTVRQLLEDFSVRFRDPLGVEPEVEISLRHTVGRAWQMLGGSNRPEDSQEAHSERERSDMEQAETHFLAALELALKSKGAGDALTAVCRQRLAWLLRDRGFYQKAAEELRAAVSVFGSTNGESAPETLSAKAMLASVLLRLDERDSALTLARVAAAWPADSPAAVQPLQLAARVCLSTGDSATAAAAGERALRIARSLGSGTDGPRCIQPLLTLAEVRAAAGQREDAVLLAESAVGIARATFGEKHPETSKATLRLTALRGAAAAVSPEGEGAASSLRTAIGDGHPDTIAGMAALMSSVDTKAAREMAEQFAGVPRGGRASGAPVMVKNLPSWIQKLVDGNRLKDFEGVTKGVIEMSRRTWGADHLNTIDAERILAEMYVTQKEYDKTLEVMIPNVERTRRKLGDAHPLTTEGLIMIARAHHWKKDTLAMEPVLQEVRRLLEGLAQDSTAGYHWSWLGDIFNSLGRYTPALDCYRRAAALLKEDAHFETGHAARVQVMRLSQQMGRSLEARDARTAYLSAARGHLAADAPELWSAEYSAMVSLQNTLLWREASADMPRFRSAPELPGDKTREALTRLVQSFDSRIASRERELVRERAAWEKASSANGPEHEATFAALRTWTAACGNAGGAAELDKALEQLDALAASTNPLTAAEAACEAAWYRGIFRGLAPASVLDIMRTASAAVPEGESPAAAVRLVNRIYSFSRHGACLHEAAPVIDAAMDRMAGSLWPQEETTAFIPRFSSVLCGCPDTEPVAEWRTDPAAQLQGWVWKQMPVANNLRPAPASHFSITAPFELARPQLARAVFTVENPAAYQALRLRLRCADGVIVWLNGKEVLRRRVEAGVTFDGNAASEPPSPEPELCALCPVDPSALKAGPNVIAFAVYLAASRQSPTFLTLDFALEARKKPHAAP